MKKEKWNGDSLMELKQEGDLQSKIPSGVAKSIFADIQLLKTKQAEESQKKTEKLTPDEIRKSRSFKPVNIVDDETEHVGSVLSTTSSIRSREGSMIKAATPIPVDNGNNNPLSSNEFVELFNDMRNIVIAYKSTSPINMARSGTVINNSSTQSNDNCPAWDIESLKINQKQDYNCCYGKIEQIIEKFKIEKNVRLNTISKNQLQEITQNLIIQARFSYQFLNPQRLLKSVLLENKNTISFLRIKIGVRVMNSDEINDYVNMISELPEEDKTEELHLLSARIPYAGFAMAIIIGPFYIEWNRFGIATVRNKHYSHDVLFFDAKVVKGNDEITTLLSKLSTWACYWNGQKDFDILHANSYTFCKTIFENIECLNDFPSHIKDLIELFKLGGVCGNTIYLNSQLEKCIQQHGSESLRSKLIHKQLQASITFTNQRVFNEFTSIIQEHLDSEYLEYYKTLKYQLQMIERGFWCDMERNGRGMENEPLMVDNQCKAMFNPSGLLENAFLSTDEHNIHTDFEFSNYSVPLPKL